MSDCKEQVCCEQSPFDGQCCQPTPFDYSSQIYRNTEQCFTANCPAGQAGDPKTVCVPAGSYESTVSQAIADDLALSAATSAAQSELVCACAGIDEPTISPPDLSAIPLPTTVTITHPDPSAQIWYCVNGTPSGPFVLYAGPFLFTGFSAGRISVQAYVVLNNCNSETASAHYILDDSCAPYSINQTVHLQTVCGNGYIEQCNGHANWTQTFASGPYYHQSLLGVFSLYDYFPYVQMWDGECPLSCRDTPRPHTSGNLIIGPYDVDVEVFSITQLFIDNVFSIDDDEVPACACSLPKVCPSVVLKTLAAGQTMTFKVWCRFGAHSWAAGILGVREVGVVSACAPNTLDSCGCNAGSIESAMRAAQERYRVGFDFNPASSDPDGTWMAWPNNHAGSLAGKYPIDGFYSLDSDAEKLQHVKDLATNFSLNNWLNNYATVNTSFDGLTTIPHYDTTLLGVPDPSSITVWQDGLSTMRQCLCRLTEIIVEVTSNIVSRYAQGTGTDLASAVGDNCAQMKSIANTDIWNPSGTTPSVAFPQIKVLMQLAAGPLSGLGPDYDGRYGFNWSIDCRSGALSKDLTNYGDGTVYAYAKEKLPFPETTIPSVLNYQNYAPHSFTDELYHQFDVQPLGGTYTSSNFGYTADNFPWNQDCVPICDQLYWGSGTLTNPPTNCVVDSPYNGFEVTAYILHVHKSNVPSSNEWIYYP